MAVTSVHAIKSTLSKAIDYIEDQEKTSGQELVSGYHVDPLSAATEFALTAAAARQRHGDRSKVGGSENLAYHLIQSFAPEDGVTPEQAHEIGRQLADQLLGGKYEYVITTHVDTDHIHNHIIFNATSYQTFKKWDPGYKGKVAFQIQQISDKLCEEQGLSVLRESWTKKLKRLLDQAIEASSNYQEFLANLEANGVEVKEGARISFRLPHEGMEHFRRGDRIKGGDYSREGILRRLDAPAPEEQNVARSQYTIRKEQRARLDELAQALSTVRTEHIDQDEDFGRVTDELQGKMAETQDTIQQVERKIIQYAKVVNYLSVVRGAGDILSDPKNAALQTSSGELRYEAEFYALAQLRKLGVDPSVDPAKVEALIREQQDKVDGLKAQASEIERRIKALQAAQSTFVGLRGDEKEAGNTRGHPQGKGR